MRVFYAKATYDNKEIAAVNKVLRNPTALMNGPAVKEFEYKASKLFGKKYGLMVNSGSSANLIATFAAGNLMRKNALKRGDEVLVPALCWSTSIWPLVQFGLKLKFIDIDIETLNINIDDLKYLDRKLNLFSFNKFSAQSLKGPRNQLAIGTLNPFFGRRNRLGGKYRDST